MLTKNEITVLNLSPTKKDFVQIWNELLEVAGKLSERWDPTSTNESDPGIVILKALTGIADKLNYNIDKNTLEAFMPTAAQEDSMRKLCDMLGYTMKYYRSAETTVNIKYFNADPSEDEAAIMTTGLYIPKFTVVTNSDRDVNYFTTNKVPIYISSDWPSASEVPCMEGQLVKCESINNNGVITVSQISENNRFYLPETQIAENGIFIYNVDNTHFSDNSTADGTEWTRVDNLNIQARGARVFKFGYDSYESRPYVEFPADYSELFNDGLFIYYARTSGTNGNISTRTLTQLELPGSAEWSKISAESFSVENVFSANSGANPESIRQAYTNFKKTIGTFETLVTCRDYMNKIYSLVNEKTGKPFVSNILVTDIRNDLNRATTICSCDDVGIFYKEVPFVNTTVKTSTEVLGSETIITKVVEKENAIDHFDLVFYPFKSYNQIKSNVKDIKAVYDASFTYSNSQISNITGSLNAAGIQNMSHNIKMPRKGDLISINNYLRLTATIATNSKVTEVERSIIIDNIKIALANAFNMRELDFGDEIPFDSIIEVIETADSRIRVASLNEPALYTTFSVLEDITNNTPKIVEYAVASDWLDTDMAASTGRLTKIEEFVNSEGKTETRTVSTFNTKEAKQIYNKLVVRNILAGRVPLFNYNNTFKTSFSESPYLITTIIPTKPSNLAEPTEDAPFTMWTENNVIYTGQLVFNEQTGATQIIYTETKTPKEFEDFVEDNVIKETVGDSSVDDTGAGSGATGSTGNTGSLENGSNTSTGVSDYITNIRTSCKLFADEYNTITDVTLADGEFVRFRAPNFTTVKTYPAYVNYNLSLDTALKSTAVAAEATALFDILDSDRTSWSTLNTNIRWQKVLNYFKNIDKNFNTSYKKTFTLAQTVSAFKEFEEKPQTGKINVLGIDVNNSSTESTEYTVEQYVALSGCVKLTNKNFKARVAWTPADGESAPKGNVPVEVDLSKLANPFITSSAVLEDIMDAVDSSLATYRDTLPKECSWTVYFDFECVPFEAKSLAAWEKFVSTCALYYNKEYKYQVFDYKPVSENDTFLWRTIGEGYDIGKYVMENFNKLLKFNKTYFNLLPEVYLAGIFVVENIGANAEPTVIKNNEEYKLRQNEHLYIEYTPSTTTEDTSGSNQAPITEVYGEGTIIRPNGFDIGLYDSTVYGSLGNTSHKQVTFTQVSSSPVNMFSLGASEQIEIRDLSKVEISKNSFNATSSGIYLYKNFNDCPALEVKDTNANGERINNTYTLKDGEYVFYTDQNKADFAYYTSGTQVTLTGELVLPVFDVIELSTIFDSGLDEIPWKYKSLDAADRIIFQEFQYTTLGPGDTIKDLVLTGNNPNVDLGDGITSRYLNEVWQYCDDVKYSIANAPDTAITLASINLPDRPGNGWEASSTLELDVTPTSAQTLRRTDKVETSLILSRTSTSGGVTKENIIVPVASSVSATTSLPLAFKTNVDCQACGSDIAIGDVYNNPNNVQGFQLKVFATDAPVLVTTYPDTVAPYSKAGLFDITTWTGEPLTGDTGGQELWNQLALSRIKAARNPQAIGAFDNALRLSVSLLQNTYGLFCIYLDKAADEAEDLATKVWIEVLPGTSSDTVALLNYDNVELDSQNRLYLHAGINCVRVRKSCKLFVKASPDAEGVLYFDEPKLVNSQKLEYINANQKSVPLYTSGLNLAQLGYLDASGTDDTKLDEVTRAKLHSAYIAEAIDEANNELRTIDIEISNKYKTISELLPKIQTLVAAEKALSDELTNIKAIEPERLAALTAKYNSISKTLDSERALLTALTNNVKADEIEQKLVVLLNSFTNTVSTQQQILEDLATLKANARASAESLSSASIIADYNAMAAKSDLADVFTEVSKVATDSIEKNYQEQLSVLVSNLEQVVNSDERNSLIEALSKLRATETAEAQATLRTLTNKLNDILEQDSINSTLTEMTDAAASADYTRLYTLTSTLSGLIESRGLAAVIAEISQVVNELEDSNSNQLSELLSELKTLTNQLGSTESGLRADISSLAAAVKAKVDAGATSVDATITDKVAKLSKTFINDFKAQLIQAITDMEACVVDLQKSTPIKELIELLEGLEDGTDKNSKVGTLVEDIKELINQRTDYRVSLSEVTYNTWLDSAIESFVYNAILTVWPNYLSARFTSLLSSIDSVFASAINGELADFADRYSELQDLLDQTKNPDLTNILLNSLSASDFMALLNKVKSLLSNNEQNEVNTELVASISNLVQNSDELTTALTDTGNNAVLTSLIADWQNAPNVVQKQQLQLLLKEELARIIDTDEQLLNVIAEILCPAIKALEADLDSKDKFYENFLATLSSAKAAVLKNNITDIVITIDSAYLELAELSLTEFKTKLISFVKPKASLLPAALVTDIDTLKNTSADFANDQSILSQLQGSLDSQKLIIMINSIKNTAISDVLKKLKANLEDLENMDTIAHGYEGVFAVLKLEDQLLADIRKIDVNREFYYSLSGEDRLAIELNESDKKLNTLMNPLTNYDINNVNNSFVISKLDIDYLDNGIQIARSSRLN